MCACSTTSPAFPLAGASIHLVSRDEALLPRTWKMNSDTRPAGAAQLPSGGVQLRRAAEVRGIDELDPIGECETLRTRPWKAQPHLAAGLEVVDELIQRPALAAGDELGDRRKLAFFHRGLQVGAGRSFREAAAPPELSQQQVALAADGGKLLVKRPHALAHRRQPSFDLGCVQLRQVIRHLPETLRLVLGATVAEGGEKGQVIDDLQPSAGEEWDAERGRADGDTRQRRAERLGYAPHRARE